MLWQLLLGIFMGLYLLSEKFRHYTNLCFVYIFHWLFWIFYKIDYLTCKHYRIAVKKEVVTAPESDEQIEIDAESFSELIKNKKIRIEDIH